MRAGRGEAGGGGCQVLAVLQSAYRKGRLAHSRHWRVWEAELVGSRTWTRLARAVAGLPGVGPARPGRLPVGVRAVNSSAVVTERIDEVPPSDPARLARALARHRPAVVLACGGVALALCRALWAGHLVAIPHPACRVLTNGLLDAAGRSLAAILSGPPAGVSAGAAGAQASRPPRRLSFVQGRGSCEAVPLS